jgi:hypothetical protein
MAPEEANILLHSFSPNSAPEFDFFFADFARDSRTKTFFSPILFLFFLVSSVLLINRPSLSRCRGGRRPSRRLAFAASVARIAHDSARVCAAVRASIDAWKQWWLWH